MQKPEYEVRIEGCDNGVLIRIGCKSLVVPEEKLDEALQDVKLYLTGGHKANRALRVKWLKDSDEADAVCTGTTCNEALPQGVPEPPVYEGRL